MVELIHHAASIAGGPPPNTLWALGECLRAGVNVEVDVTPLADSGWLLAHDRDLEAFSTGRGPVAAITTADSRGVFLVRDGQVTHEHPSLLGDALDLVERLPGPAFIQLDLKALAALPPTALAGLVSLVAPVRDRVLVSSPADWCLRELRALAPWIRLGFDPQYYLDDRQNRCPDGTLAPPRASRLGYFYGCAPEDAAIEEVSGEVAYLGNRFTALAARADAAEIWFVRAALLLRIADVLDPVAHLHHRGVKVAAWTVDPVTPSEAAAARRLVALGVDYITTNRAEGLALLI